MTGSLGPGRNRSDAQYVEYIADMILELQGLAQRFGHEELAQRLLGAYEAAREAGEAGADGARAENDTRNSSSGRA